jgi:hypothetical protein
MRQIFDARAGADPDTLLERLEHALITGLLDRRGFLRAAAAAGSRRRA